MLSNVNENCNTCREVGPYFVSIGWILKGYVNTNKNIRKAPKGCFGVVSPMFKSENKKI